METHYDILQPKQQNQSLQQIVFDPFQQFDQQQQQQQQLQLQQHMMQQQQQQQQQLQYQQMLMQQQQLQQQVQQMPQQQSAPLYPDLNPPPNYQQGFIPQSIPQETQSNGSGFMPTLQLCPICQMAVPGEQLSIHLHYCSIQQQQQQFMYQQQLQQNQNSQLIPTISPVQNVNQQHQVQQQQPQYVIMAPGSAQQPQTQTSTTTTVSTVKSGGSAPMGQSAPLAMKPATSSSPHSKLVLDKKLLLQTTCSAMNGEKAMNGNGNVFKTHFNFVSTFAGRTIVVTIPYDTVNEIRTENDSGKKVIKFFTKDGKFHTFFNFKGKNFDKAFDLLTKNHHHAQKIY